jgi:hypothetical protein
MLATLIPSTSFPKSTLLSTTRSLLSSSSLYPFEMQCSDIPRHTVLPAIISLQIRIDPCSPMPTIRLSLLSHFPQVVTANPLLSTRTSPCSLSVPSGSYDTATPVHDTQHNQTCPLFLSIAGPVLLLPKPFPFSGRTIRSHSCCILGTQNSLISLSLASIVSIVKR